jgi:hypothetical protein
MHKIIIRKGQVWKKKANGVKLIILAGSGNEWKGERYGMQTQKPRTHHITAWELNKKWELLEPLPA